jgi:Zn-dependent protease with chaperone function
MARPMTTFIRNLVRKTTGANAYLFGVLPSFTTLLSLTLVAGAVAGSTVLLSSAASILPVMGVTVGIAFVNYFFSREIQTAMLGLTPTSAYVKNDLGQELEQDWVYDIGLKKQNGKKVEYNFAKAMDHLRGVINAQYPNEAPLPRIRLGTIAEHHYKLVVTGRNPGKSMIAIANPGVFHTFKGKTREFNALMLQALAQIKLRSTFSGMAVGVVMDFGNLLTSFKNHDFLPLKILGSVVSPFGQLLINSMSRTNAYYRADRIVAECGYGEDLIKALDILNNPNNIARVNTHRARRVEAEPTGRLAPVVRLGRNVKGALRADSYPGEDETGYTVLQFIDNAVMRFAFFFKELFSAAPRMGHRKEEIKACIKAYQDKHEGKKPEMQLPSDPDADYKYCNVATLEQKLAKYAHGGHHHEDHHEVHQDDAEQPAEPAAVVFRGKGRGRKPVDATHEPVALRRSPRNHKQ